MFGRMPTDGMGLQEEEALWDGLVAWCNARHLFLGGSPDGAVIYSPFEHGLQEQWKALRRMLGQRMELASLAPSMVSVGELPSPRLRRACLEAVSQAQRHLAERMQECTDSLAGLSSSAGMRLAVAITEGKSLEIRSRYSHLIITVSRLDGKREPAFERFESERLRPANLTDLIVDWATLPWKRQPSASHPSSAEWVAASGDLRISLSAEPGSTLDHLQLMKLFWQLMNDD